MRVRARGDDGLLTQRAVLVPSKLLVKSTRQERPIFTASTPAPRWARISRPSRRAPRRQRARSAVGERPSIGADSSIVWKRRPDEWNSDMEVDPGGRR
jgi:hypothetical protein